MFNSLKFALKQAINRTTPDMVLPIVSYEPKFEAYWLNDGYLGFVMIGDPSPGIMDGTAEKLSQFFASPLPSHTLLLVSLWVGGNTTEVRDAMRSPGGAYRRNELFEANPADLDVTQQVYRNVFERKIEFMDVGSSRPIESYGGTTVRNSKLIISLKLPLKNPSQPTEQEMTEAYEHAKRLLQTCEAIGLYMSMAQPSEYLSMMDEMLNWSPEACWRKGQKVEWDENRPINQQLLDPNSEWQISKKGVWMGEHKFVKSLSPKLLPSIASIFAMQNVVGNLRVANKVVPGNFMFSTAIYWPDVAEVKGGITAQKNVSLWQTSGPLAKFVPRVKKRAESFDLLSEELDNGQRPVMICPNILIFSDSEKQAAETYSAMSSYYTELGFNFFEDNISAIMALNMLPLCQEKSSIPYLKRYHTVASTHAAHFMPISSDWRGTGTAVMQFYGRSGQPQAVDLFNSQTNFNLTIAAESGSGKSFLTNDLLVSYLSCGAKAFVIDVGRSYLKLCKALGGEFMEFSSTSNLCLNPFSLIQDYSEESDMIVGLIMAMAFPTEKPSDFQTGALKNILMMLWEEKSTSATIDDVVEKCLEHEDPTRRIQDIGDQLFPFSSRGEYGRFFVGVNNVTFESNFTCLELEELKGREQLQRVILLQLIYQIQQEMYLGDRNIPKIIVIDEAWDLLSKGETAKFIETAYRRARKYNGAIVTVTQSINDLYKTSSGVAIAENAANMILLGQKRETIDSLKRENRLSISEGAFEIIKTVRSVRGVYSEIFFNMNGGQSMGIGRLIVDRFTQLLYSTHPNDINAVDDRLKRGMDINAAINDVISMERAA